MDLKGTRTEANLRSAFAGETQARSKYDYFAKAAEKEGFQQIAAIFRETADNEEAHAFLWFSQLGALSNTGQKSRERAVRRAFRMGGDVRGFRQGRRRGRFYRHRK